MLVSCIYLCEFALDTSFEDGIEKEKATGIINRTYSKKASQIIRNTH